MSNIYNKLISEKFCGIITVLDYYLREERKSEARMRYDDEAGKKI